MNEVTPNVYKHFGNKVNEVTEDVNEVQLNINKMTSIEYKHLRYEDLGVSECFHLH